MSIARAELAEAKPGVELERGEELPEALGERDGHVALVLASLGVRSAAFASGYLQTTAALRTPPF